MLLVIKPDYTVHLIMVKTIMKPSNEIGLIDVKVQKNIIVDKNLGIFGLSCTHQWLLSQLKKKLCLK